MCFFLETNLRGKRMESVEKREWDEVVWVKFAPPFKGILSCAWWVFSRKKSSRKLRNAWASQVKVATWRQVRHSPSLVSSAIPASAICSFPSLQTSSRPRPLLLITIGHSTSISSQWFVRLQAKSPRTTDWHGANRCLQQPYQPPFQLPGLVPRLQVNFTPFGKEKGSDSRSIIFDICPSSIFKLSHFFPPTSNLQDSTSSVEIKSRVSFRGCFDLFNCNSIVKLRSIEFILKCLNWIWLDQQSRRW